MNNVCELRRLYQDFRLLPFVGAGVSASVRWKDSRGTWQEGPSWAKVVERAAHELGFQDVELALVRGTHLQILEYYKLRFEGHTRLTNWLFRNMNPSDEDLENSVIHRELAQLTKCPIIYTTNFDDFIERSFRIHGRSHKAVAIESHMGLPGENTEVLKFHGDWNHPDRMVLTESDYERRMEFRAPMDIRFRSDLMNRSVLFLGYSFRDPNVSYLFRQVREQFSALPNTDSGRRAYIVVEEPSRFERRLFQERNIEVIAIDSRNRADEIATLLSEIRS